MKIFMISFLVIATILLITIRMPKFPEK